MKKLLISLSILSLLYLLTFFIASEKTLGIRVNKSKSLPSYFFLSYKGKVKPKRGSYVAFSHPESAYLVVKQIAALEGDIIEIRENKLFINNKLKGEILEKSPRSGIKLTPQKHKTIPKGYAFVMGQHKESFDSRYDEFGLISLNEIKENLWPVF